MCVRAHLVFVWNSWRSLVWHNEQALPASSLIYAWHWPVNQTRDTFILSTANWFFIIHFRLSDKLWESLKDPCVLSWIFDAIWCFLSSPSLSPLHLMLFFLLRKCDLSWELYGAGLWVRRRGTLIQSIAATAVSWRGASLQRSTRNPTQLKSYHFKNTLYREEQKARDWNEK